MSGSDGIQDIDRRAFLRTVTAVGLGGLALPACARGESASSPGDRLDRIGVQLYTVRERMRRSVPETLRAVAELGYREVETHDLFGLSPERFRAELDRVGLVSPAGHVPLQEIRENPGATLGAARTLGQRWVIVPWIDEAQRTPDGYRELAEALNRFGAASRDRGIRAGYHNHEFEFLPLEGGISGFDLLLAETDPALVDFELDLFWAVKGGSDPLTLFQQHPGRFPLCHVKDMADIGGEQRMVAVGQGEIDFARIFGQGEQAGLRHFFVEHDNPPDSLASLRTSIEHLRQLTF